MKAEVRHDYVDVDTSRFITSLVVAVDDVGVYVSVACPDYEQSGGHPIDFYATVEWEPLVDEAIAFFVDDFKMGASPYVDKEGMIEVRNQCIAQLEQLIERLRALPSKEEK